MVVRPPARRVGFIVTLERHEHDGHRLILSRGGRTPVRCLGFALGTSLLLATTHAHAQAAEGTSGRQEEHPPPNSVYLEGLGAGVLYSLNYERLLTDDLGVRGGVSYISCFCQRAPDVGGADYSYFVFPLTA